MLDVKKSYRLAALWLWLDCDVVRVDKSIKKVMPNLNIAIIVYRKSLDFQANFSGETSINRSNCLPTNIRPETFPKKQSIKLGCEFVLKPGAGSFVYIIKTKLCHTFNGQCVLNGLLYSKKFYWRKERLQSRPSKCWPRYVAETSVC